MHPACIIVLGILSLSKAQDPKPTDPYEFCMQQGASCIRVPSDCTGMQITDPNGGVNEKRCKSIVAYNNDATFPSDAVFMLSRTLVAEKSAQYVAVGFSEDEKMGSDPVTACVNLDGTATVLAAYNPSTYTELVDPAPADLFTTIETSVENDVLKCYYRQVMNPADLMDGKLPNLKNSYYFLSAFGPADPSTGKPNKHSTNDRTGTDFPKVAAKKWNVGKRTQVNKDTAVKAVSAKLIQLTDEQKSIMKRTHGKWNVGKRTQVNKDTAVKAVSAKLIQLTDEQKSIMKRTHGKWNVGKRTQVNKDTAVKAVSAKLIQLTDEQKSIMKRTHGKWNVGKRTQVNKDTAVKAVSAKLIQLTDEQKSIMKRAHGKWNVGKRTQVNKDTAVKAVSAKLIQLTDEQKSIMKRTHGKWNVGKRTQVNKDTAVKAVSAKLIQLTDEQKSIMKRTHGKWNVGKRTQVNKDTAVKAVSAKLIQLTDEQKSIMKRAHGKWNVGKRTQVNKDTAVKAVSAKLIQLTDEQKSIMKRAHGKWNVGKRTQVNKDTAVKAVSAKLIQLTDEQKSIMKLAHGKWNVGKRTQVNKDTAVKAVSAKLIQLTDEQKSIMKRAHGVLMICGWWFFVAIAIMFARYFKNMWPFTKPMGAKLWFHMHRFMNIWGLLCFVAAFVIIFVVEQKWVGGTYKEHESFIFRHSVCGMIAVIGGVLQPIMALCRCNPKAGSRWIFNWAHRILGLGSFACAGAAIWYARYFPNYINDELWSDAPFYLYILYFAALGAAVIALEAHITATERFASNKVGNELELHQSPNGRTHTVRTNVELSKKHTNIRCVILTLFAVISAVVCAVLCYMVVEGPKKRASL